MITDQRQITNDEWLILAAIWLLSDNTKHAYNMLYVLVTYSFYTLMECIK